MSQAEREPDHLHRVSRDDTNRMSGAAPDEEWNAGDLGCGELVLELMMRMAHLAAGQTLKLVALDPGAPADLPAWCRMTGHTLVSNEPPVYLIRRTA